MNYIITGLVVVVQSQLLIYKCNENFMHVHSIYLTTTGLIMKYMYYICRHPLTSHSVKTPRPHC